MNMADRHLPPDVGDFKVTQPRLALIANGFINLFVLFNAPEEIAFRVVPRHVCVIRVTRRDFEGDVGVDDGLVLTDRLEEDDTEAAFACDAFGDFSSMW